MSKGGRQTPKSLCIGVTFRHLTGSSQIVSLLNRLGHCASWDTVVSLDTSLAQLHLLEGRENAKGILKEGSYNTCALVPWCDIKHLES